MRVVKGYHAEAREEEVFASGVQRLLNNVLKSLTATSFMSLSATVLMGVVGAVIMYVGARQITAGAMTLGDFMTFTALLAFLIAPMFQIVGIGTQLTEALAGLERTREVLRERPEDQDPRRTVTLPPITGQVVFDDVNFAYDAGKTVLHDVSFRAEPGTVTALVGPSGSGKSTIIGLIAAFHGPNREPFWWMAWICPPSAWIPTARSSAWCCRTRSCSTEPFERTSRSPGRMPPKQQILEACRIARVDEFAESFEKEYDTIVGERGVKLSGGQRQRVSIARAILADPRILILDEATSSLDSESEAMIQEGLQYLMQGRTTFVIAHRLSTIRRADQILVVEAGRIVERGTHEELYAAGGRYYDLYTKQHGIEANLFLAPGEGSGQPAENGEAQPAGAPERRTRTSSRMRCGCCAAETASLSALLQQLGHQSRPARLMAGAQPGAIVAVEILVEQNVIAEMRIGLKFLRAAKYRPAAMLVAQEKTREPARQLRGDFRQVHLNAGAGGTFHLQFVAEIMMEPLQRFDHQIIHRKPDRPAPVGVSAEHSGGAIPRVRNPRGIPVRRHAE